ncbi:amidohydrolase family protein [Amycolatopsis jejuensis]|uniref:amidohydrolase family protein n=1 Tax=Amycolatopsis jejuensis TaxID=330084 RepID=UPI00052636A8|nr:amidohydrolase family protein [Amycolatopsis jejuensis]
MTDAIRDRVRALTREIGTARGHHRADLVLRNCHVISPYSNETHPADVVLLGRRIVAVRENFDGPAAREEDCSGLLAAPGLVEPHLLPDPDLTWAEIGWNAVRTGTTTVVTPELGPADGIARYDLPGRLFEATGHGLTQRSGPSADYAGATVQSAAATHGLGMARVPGSSVRSTLRMGRTVLVPDDAEVLTAIADGTLDARHLCLGTGSGQVLPEVARALAAGISAPVALQLGSLNAATHYGLDHVLGSITPGRWADFFLTEDLGALPTRVYVGGVLVAENGNRP